MDGFLANGQRVYEQNDKRMFHWEAKDEYGVYRNEHGYARAVDGRAILVSKEDIRAIVERATLHEHSYICLLEHAEGYTTSIPESDTYNKQKLIECSIDWLTTSMHEIKQDLAMLQKQQGVGARRSKSIDAHTQTLIDASIQASIDARFTSFEDRLQSFTYRLDGICYPLRDSIDELISRLDALQQDMDMIDHGFDQLLHMISYLELALGVVDISDSLHL
ncbi:hypothetical protein F2Q70_00002977 [Brassica cretica]|uniref:Uncharacterized protein n=1 Tax=Brassica cretica TaxID=69181 RepID=A0A8S9J199_BRACR|nr:hypothetical protein F2Q70_00002977 [Brassica cretica]